MLLVNGDGTSTIWKDPGRIRVRMEDLRPEIQTAMKPARTVRAKYSLPISFSSIMGNKCLIDRFSAMVRTL